MARRAKRDSEGGLLITDVKSYTAKRFSCEQFALKRVDIRTQIGWCKKADCSCVFKNCPKVNNNK